MAENEGSTSSSSSRALSAASLRPTITLPPRSAMESIFTGGAGASPGPMTLVAGLFSDNDPESECRSFSQLLAGAMASPAAVSGHRPSFFRAEDASFNDREANGAAGDSFRFQQSRPAGLSVGEPSSSASMFTVPPGLSPASLLHSPGFFTTGQGHYGMSHQQALAQVTAQAAQSQSHMHIQAEYAMPQLPPFTSNMTTQQQMPPSVPEPNIQNEASDVSHSDQRSYGSSFTVDKPAEDGYNWRKYGQKQVKGSEYPRSYYKCTHPNCPVKKKVERSFDGQVTEIIYKGQHNHQPPHANKRAKENGNLSLQGNSESTLEGQSGSLNKSKEGVPAYLTAMKDQESSQATGSSDSEEVGDAETRVDEGGEDEPEPKRRNTEVKVSEPSSSHRTVTEPRIIVQTTSEVDLLDDGYRWRKYGQKVVKGNPYPRSYYKCTSPGCNVRKHIERAAADHKAVITTYEGKHNHEVPAARNSSHNTLQLKPHNVHNHASAKETDFGSNDPQPIARLQFKQEQIR